MPTVNPSIALSMIVKNGEQTLEMCLASVKGVVEEIVIGDTGSTDRTIELARRFGARVVPVEWTDDFAAARNRVLEEHRADWILQLDADEELEPDICERVKGVLQTQADGFLLPIHNYVANGDEVLWDSRSRRHSNNSPRAARFPYVTVHQNVRLFRRAAHVVYSGRVHESVGPSILAAGRLIGTLDVPIHHFERELTEEERCRKDQFYRKLARKKIEDRPGDPQAFLELALLELDRFSNPHGAATLLQKACNLAPESGMLQFFLGVAMEKSGDHLAAIGKFQRAVERRYCTPLLLEYAGESLYNGGFYPDAVEMFEQAMKISATPTLESKLGLAHVRCGNYQIGRDYLERAVRKEPRLAQNHDRLISALLFLNDITQAASNAEHKIECISPEERDFHRAAALWSKAGNECRALHALACGLVRFPESELLGGALEEIKSNPAA